MSRPRVFVSSVVEGFEVYRAAARAAIHSAGGEAILVNEDFPSIHTSSRNACLDAVASSDIFVLLIGTRGGWRTPSGRLVIEEELEEARRRRLPILVFIEDVEQDGDARTLSKTVSDYVEGYFRVRFQGPDGLGREVVRALRPLIEISQRPTMNSNELSPFFGRPYKSGGPDHPPVRARSRTPRGDHRPCEARQRGLCRTSSGNCPLEVDQAVRLRVRERASLRFRGFLDHRTAGRKRLASRHQGGPSGASRVGSHDTRFERHRSNREGEAQATSWAHSESRPRTWKPRLPRTSGSQRRSTRRLTHMEGISDSCGTPR